MSHFVKSRRVWVLFVGGAAVAAALALISRTWRMDTGAREQAARALADSENRAVHLIAQGQIEEGQRLLAEIESKHPAPGALLYRAGMAFLDAGDITRSVSTLERARTANPDEPLVSLGLGEALLEAGRPADALPLLEPLRAGRDVDATRSGFALMRAYLDLGRTDVARQTVTSLPLSPTIDADDLVEVGAAAIELQEPAVAEKFLREAVRRAPTLAVAQEHLGVAIGMQRKDGEAVSALETAVRLDGSRATAHFRLAIVYAQHDRLDDARSHVEEALRLRPGWAEAEWLRGELGEPAGSGARNRR